MEIGDKMIPREICEKYNVADIEYYDSDIDFYYACLSATDHIPNKIIESLVENLADATALNFITLFIKFIVDVRVRYSDVLKLRKQAREEINRLEGETIEGETV